MTNPATRTIFLSYSHMDQKLLEEIQSHLRQLQHQSCQIWIDKTEIEGGDAWRAKVHEGLRAADLAVIFLSRGFLGSKFIFEEELPKLMQRSQQEGIPIYPVLLRDCEWGVIKWLKELQLRPEGAVPLEDLDSTKRGQALKSMVLEISDKLQILDAADLTELPDGQARSIRLLTNSVLSSEEVASARYIVRRIIELTQLSGEALFEAVRFVIEHQLLYSEDPSFPDELWHSDADVVSQLQKLDFLKEPQAVDPLFFFRTMEREALWKRYFQALSNPKIGRLEPGAVESLCRVCVDYGFLAPQFLVSGLMARFDNDWKPVMNAYTRRFAQQKGTGGERSFEAIQASQWVCWLVWGPSIPICNCEQWHGQVALQYGFGDENNALPLLDAIGDDAIGDKVVDASIAELRSEGRTAVAVKLTGRLVWGQWALMKRSVPPPDTTDRAPGEEEDVAAPVAVVARPGAAAQSSLFSADGGLMLRLEKGDTRYRHPQVYYSSYLWLAFLVATRGDASDGCPRLLREKQYPPWPGGASDRQAVIEQRLWEELLPIFVHANIADPIALQFYKRDLVDRAIRTLRHVWDNRARMFDAKDVEGGIEFHLVCGSDYTGCGCEVRYPGMESLVDIMRERLGGLPMDDGFARAVVLPHSGGNTDSRPGNLARFFSSCHIPELIHDYYTYVRQRGAARCVSTDPGPARVMAPPLSPSAAA